MNPRCVLCGGMDMAPGLVSIPFERGELRLEVRQVPALVCPACGDACLEEAVTAAVLDFVEEIAVSGVRGGTFVFSAA